MARSSSTKSSVSDPKTVRNESGRALATVGPVENLLGLKAKIREGFESNQMADNTCIFARKHRNFPRHCMDFESLRPTY